MPRGRKTNWHTASFGLRSWRAVRGSRPAGSLVVVEARRESMWDWGFERSGDTFWREAKPAVVGPAAKGPDLWVR